MQRQTSTKNKPESITSPPLSRGILQRKCGCGNQFAGGGECAECGNKNQFLQRRTVHLSEAGDRYEQEADRVADQVMRMPEPTAKHQVGSEKEGILQRKAIANSITPVQPSSTSPDQSSELPPIVSEVINSPGQSLDTGTRAFMESRFSYDFSQVQVHTGAKAADSTQAINSLAYAVGQDLVFGEDQYAPKTNRGKRLLAHELAHVVQQQPFGVSMLQRMTNPNCGKDFLYKFDAIANTEKEKNHRGVPRVLYSKIPGKEDSGTVAKNVDNTTLLLTPGMNLKAGQLHNFLWRAVCYSPASESPEMIYWVLNEYLSRANEPKKEESKKEKSKKEEPKQENQGVSERVLEVVGDVPSPERYEQLRCVIEKTACGSQRPGGIPEPSEFDSANEECKKEKGYTGTENLYPTYDECNEIGTASPLAPARLEQAQKLISEYLKLVGAGLLTKSQIEALDFAITKAKESVENLVPESSAPAPVQDNEGESLSIAASAPISLVFRTVPGFAGGTAGGALALAVVFGGTYIYLSHEKSVIAASAVETLIGELAKIKPLPLKPEPEISDKEAEEIGKEFLDKLLPKTDPIPKTDPGTDPLPKTKPTSTTDYPPVPDPVRCPTGTKSDPITMVWFKPLSEYKNPLYLWEEPYYRNQRKKLLDSNDYIGVKNWPTENPYKPLKRTSTIRGKEAYRFKKALEDGGFNWKGYSPDHVQDLMFEGDDAFSNLWPLDSSVNTYAGTWHSGQPVCYSTLTNPRKVEALGSATLVDKYFIIRKVIKLVKK